MAGRATGRAIRTPQHWVKAMRTTATGEEVLGFVGYVDQARPTGDKLAVSLKGPAGLLEERPLPFPPPGIEHGTNEDAFGLYWRVLDYVFALPDPKDFPALPGSLDGSDQETVDRFIETRRDLAASTMLNSVDDAIQVAVDDDNSEGHVTAQFSRRDSQAGFAVLLRHCHSDKEPARFARVADIIWQANERRHDGDYDRRRAVLQQWRRAAGQLQQKSLDQLMREKLAREEAMTILDYPEQWTPSSLLSAFNYGDLLHWDERKRKTIAGWQADDFEGPQTRLAFLAAAAGLAHVYIGFGELAAAATT